MPLDSLRRAFFPSLQSKIIIQRYIDVHTLSIHERSQLFQSIVILYVAILAFLASPKTISLMARQDDAPLLLFLSAGWRFRLTRFMPNSRLRHDDCCHFRRAPQGCLRRVTLCGLGRRPHFLLPVSPAPRAYSGSRRNGAGRPARGRAPVRASSAGSRSDPSRTRARNSSVGNGGT